MNLDTFHARIARAALAGVLLAASCVSLAQAQIRSHEPRLIKVNDRVYCATGYALANVIYVVTDTSLVVIDTTESPAAARETLAAIRQVTDKPVKYIIYTHFHGDHCNAASAFAADKPQIIAQQLHVPEMEKYRQLMMYNRRLNGLQFGFTLPSDQRGVELAPEVAKSVFGYTRPTITFDQQYRFEEGGVRFELFHAPGETLDHCYVWLPDQKTLMCGDLYYNSFPMLASPMKPERPVADWVRSLERMRELHADYLVPSHSEPITGAGQVDAVLANYAKAIRHLHDEVIRGLNRGLTIDQMRREIQLPPDLADKPYLRPLYGRIEWAINGAYRNYTGWYDFNPAHLNPSQPAELHQAILDAAGGAAPLLARAEKALAEGHPQLVLELTDIVLSVDPHQAEAHRLAAAAAAKLGDEAESGVERNIYRAAAQDHRQQAGVPSASSGAK